jgi:microcystin-dependent protein
MWTGSTAPAGWAICDGNNGTPDLRDRFVIGRGSLPTTGGSKDAVVVAHSHTFVGSSFTGTTNSAGDHQHDSSFAENPSVASAPFGLSGRTNAPGLGRIDNDNTGWLTSTAGAHSHTLSGIPAGTISASGTSGTNANLPPYYALAFIMKL